MKDEIKNKIKYYTLNTLELLIFPIICYFLFEVIKHGNIVRFSSVLTMLLDKGQQYILVSFLIIIGVSLIIRSFTKNNFIIKYSHFLYLTNRVCR